MGLLRLAILMVDPLVPSVRLGILIDNALMRLRLAIVDDGSSMR